MSATYMSTLTQSPFGNTILLIGMVIALIGCFNGYKLFKFLLKVYGFVAFSIIGFLVANLLGLTDSTLTITILVFGILGVLLSFKFYKFAMYVVVAFQVYNVIITIVPIGFIALIVSLIIGSLSLLFIKPVIAVSTATSGALYISNSLVLFLPFTSSFSIVIFIVLSVLGIFKQLGK